MTPDELPQPGASFDAIDGRLIVRITTPLSTESVELHPSQMRANASMFGSLAILCNRLAEKLEMIDARFGPLRELAPDARTPRETAEALGLDFDELTRF